MTILLITSLGLHPTPRSGSGEALGKRMQLLLIVEDDRDIRDVLVELFENSHTVEEARDGCEALDRLRNDPVPDLILLDLMMPHVTGFEVLEEMQQSERLRRVPVIVLSANENFERARQAGAIDAIRKPFDLNRLLRSIECHLPEVHS